MKVRSSKAAAYFGRNYPRLSRTALRALWPLLPNFWFFHFMVKECGARVPAYARLGNGVRLRVFLGDMMGCHIWHQGWYEPHLVRALEQRLRPEVTFFDLGANIGQYTLLAAPLVQEVHSFEPSPETYRLLAWNVKHSGFSNILANQIGVSNSSGTASLYEAGAENTGATSLKRGSLTTRCARSIQTTTLDEYVFGSDCHSRLKKPILKIDIEGAELLALEGSKELLKLRPIIFLEAIDELQRNFGRSRDELLRFLKSHGYVVHSLSESGPSPYDPLCSNILALPQS